jgi:ethanolamine ammonia-lyase small subunit
MHDREVKDERDVSLPRKRGESRQLPPSAHAGGSPAGGSPTLIDAVRARTPARILAGSAGPAYRTETQLDLRRDHSAAVDAVHAELDLATLFGAEFVERWQLFVVSTQAVDKQQYLMRPDLGRRLSALSRDRLVKECSSGADLQVVIGDGLSAAAVRKQVPGLLPLLEREAQAASWQFGRPFCLRYCRVGLLNEIGELLDPRVVVLLIGERPGLATAESLSAYMAYRPQPGHTDAQRNLISNIHERGVSWESAARRIAGLARLMGRLESSGVNVKEDLSLLSAV